MAVERREVPSADGKVTVRWLARYRTPEGKQRSQTFDRKRGAEAFLTTVENAVLVAESVTPVKGVMTWGETKGHERREVPIPRFLVESLSRQTAGRGPR